MIMIAVRKQNRSSFLFSLSFAISSSRLSIFSSIGSAGLPPLSFPKSSSGTHPLPEFGKDVCIGNTDTTPSLLVIFGPGTIIPVSDRDEFAWFFSPQGFPCFVNERTFFGSVYGRLGIKYVLYGGAPKNLQPVVQGRDDWAVVPRLKRLHDKRSAVVLAQENHMGNIKEFLEGEIRESPAAALPQVLCRRCGRYSHFVAPVSPTGYRGRPLP